MDQQYASALPSPSPFSSAHTGRSIINYLSRQLRSQSAASAPRVLSNRLSADLANLYPSVSVR